MIVRIQRFKLCFLFILHLDGRDQRGQNELPFVVNEREGQFILTSLVRMNCPSWSMSALLPTFNGRSSRPWSILVC